MTVVKIMIFVLIFLSLTGLIYYLRQSDIIKKTLQHAYAAIDEAAVENARESKRNMLLQKDETGFMAQLLERPRKRFIYSRLGYLVHGMSFEIWLVIKIASAAILYFACLTIKKDAVIGFVAIILYLVALVGMEFFLAHRNYKAVDDNLTKLINLMSNFSVTTGEITSIFHQISRYLPDPLGSVLEECYYDAQTCGDTSAALYAMAEKIEHPMFKELIRNIEICVNYTANFAVITANARKVIIDEQKSKKERRATANDNLMDMVIVSIALIVALMLVDNLIEFSIWQILLHSVAGHIALAAVTVFYVIFGLSVATAER